jgi:hypothetical protein
MSIYRGAGGAGDAVADSASEALLVQQLAIEAQASATAASGSATTASTQATNSGTSATASASSASAASTSATNASNSATAASGSASTASTQASNASTSASTATTQAGIATTKAGEASTSATNAATSASAASTSASNASTAQTAAESARDATLAAYDSFDDRYLGSKSSAPTLDNDGNALVGGALYFDSVSQSMKLYTGSAWVDAYVPGGTYLAKASNLSDLTSAPTARTNLGLGTAATEASTALVHTTGVETIAGVKTFSSTITGAVSGNAGTATALATGRTVAITGDLAYTSPSFDGSANVTAAGTLATVNSNTGSFGSTTSIPVITVNGKGLITAVSTATVSGSISVTGGDLTLSGNTGTAITNATLATVNSNTGAFGSSSSIPVITVNGKGLITAVSTSAVAGGQYFGSAATKAIAYNSTSIAENITTTSGNNCLSVGPITIASGYSVTVASGQRWLVL